MKNAIQKSFDRKKAARHAECLKKNLLKRIELFNKDLDEETKEIIHDLVQRIYPLKHETHSIFCEDDYTLSSELRNINSVKYSGEIGEILIGTLTSEMREQIELDLQIVSQRQFPDFQQTRMFCEGTRQLLGLLTRYHSVKTKKAIITAVPGGCVYDDKNAIFKEEDREYYGDTRGVYISIILENSFMMFAIQEKIHPT